VDSIISLGHGLDLAVVAEGVETAEQYRLLAAAGCDVVQGYLFGRPVSKEAVEQWRSSHSVASLTEMDPCSRHIGTIP